jgi:hypothetical protein
MDRRSAMIDINQKLVIGKKGMTAKWAWLRSENKNTPLLVLSWSIAMRESLEKGGQVRCVTNNSSTRVRGAYEKLVFSRSVSTILVVGDGGIVD